jgi:tetratricopeptide (TPR) repeat protein
LVVVVVLLAEEFVPINTLINDNTAIANPQTVVTTMFAEETAVVSSDANTTVAAGNDESVEENSTRTNIDETYDEIVQLIADDASLSAVRPLVDELLADDAITAAYTADMAYVAWYYREYDSAQELVAQVLRSNPTHRNALWVQALIEWEIVDVDVAIETLERAKNSPEVESDLLTENFGNHIDVDLATFYVGSGNRSRYFEAMQLIDPLIFTGIDWVEPYLLKGDIQMLIGDYKPACEDTYVRALRVADEEVDDIEYIEELQEDACQLAESQAENQPNRLSPPNTPLTPPRDDDNRQAPPPPPRNN